MFVNINRAPLRSPNSLILGNFKQKRLGSPPELGGWGASAKLHANLRTLFRPFVAAIVMFFLATGCTRDLQAYNPQDPPPNSYPAASVKNFIDACAAGNPQKIAVCTCGIKKIQGKYSFEAFVKLDDAAKRGEKLPTDIVDMLKGCAVKPS